MNARWIWLSATLIFAAGCGNSGSGSAAPDKPKPSTTTTAAAKGSSGPGSAAVANPEENYVAAGAKIGCLGVEGDDADRYAKERAAVLAAHSYTEDTWRAASKQYGSQKGDAIVKAMEAKCPPQL